MSKIDQFLRGLTKFELEDCLEKTRAELKTRRPFYLKQVTKKCGKPNCTCYQGYEHGPYLYATFQRDGKQVQKSLGRAFSFEEIAEMAAEPKPTFVDYRVSNKRAERFSPSEHEKKGWALHELSKEEFEQHYGLPIGGDLLDRPRMFLVNVEDFSKDTEEWLKTIRIVSSRWAGFGVGTLKGVRFLDGLVDDGYYLEY